MWMPDTGNDKPRRSTRPTLDIPRRQMTTRPSNIPCFKALIDSGSTHCFVEKTFKEKHSITTKPVPLSDFICSMVPVIRQYLKLATSTSGSLVKQSPWLLFMLHSRMTVAQWSWDITGSPNTSIDWLFWPLILWNHRQPRNLRLLQIHQHCRQCLSSMLVPF